ncbi:hypothetical protein [Parafrankia elaeagni]|uniref:hypothetical protein n=1 Tax=Parafrankia elaeagni TaxID=222534 RepID=UPI0003726321|nr:hypothetical protein [Parafrankia elaeagni]
MVDGDRNARHGGDGQRWRLCAAPRAGDAFAGPDVLGQAAGVVLREEHRQTHVTARRSQASHDVPADPVGLEAQWGVGSTRNTRDAVHQETLYGERAGCRQATRPRRRR